MAATDPPNPRTRTLRPDYPELAAHQIANARLFANRDDMMLALDLPPKSHVCEVGVAYGNFSAFILDHLQPARFVAIDIFDMHNYPVHWGVPQEVALKGMTHEDFYRDRFKDRFGIEIIPGLSQHGLRQLQDRSFDLIYVDAGHQYENVRADGEIAVTKIKDDGVVVFNDYIMFDHLLGEPYGVVQAVNEIVASGEWEVIGFSLQKALFCDIAIRKSRRVSKLRRACRAFADVMRRG
jgi:hypothetical protein